MVPRGLGDTLPLHWTNVLAGMAAGFDPALEVDCGTVPTDGSSPWRFTLSLKTTEPERSAEFPAAPFDDPAAYIRLARTTTGLIAAAQMYVARELIHDFDASGEEVVRQACFDYGVERGAQLRDRVTERGDPVNFVSLRSAVDARDPMSAVFAVGGEVLHISRARLLRLHLLPPGRSVGKGRHRGPRARVHIRHGVAPRSGRDLPPRCRGEVGFPEDPRRLPLPLPFLYPGTSYRGRARLRARGSAPDAAQCPSGIPRAPINERSHGEAPSMIVQIDHIILAVDRDYYPALSEQLKAAGFVHADAGKHSRRYTE